PGARVLGLGHRRVAAHAEEHEREDARGGDLAGGAAPGLGRAEGDAVATARVADAGDAVAQPQLVDVFRRGALLLAADVAVHVDDAGHHVVAGEVDLAAAGGEPGPLALVDARIGATDDLHVDDAVALDHHVGRAERR